MLSVYRLPHAGPEEKVVKITRKDSFILFKKLAFVFILFLAPLALSALIYSTYPEVLSGEIVYPLVVISLSAYYLFVWLFGFFMFIDYYLDVWIITNERIIDVAQKGFFNRTIAEQRLSRVQDVTSEVRGAFPTIFRYGNVFVQTAGETQRFNFLEIPRPEETRDLIIKLVEDFKEKEHEHEQNN